MYEKQGEAYPQVQTEQEQLMDELYEKIMNFNLAQQNQILRILYERTREERECRLSELKKEAEELDASLKDLS